MALCCGGHHIHITASSMNKPKIGRNSEQQKNAKDKNLNKIFLKKMVLIISVKFTVYLSRQHLGATPIE